MCPEVVTAKDTPCRVLGPTASVVQRMQVLPDSRDKEIEELKAHVKQLEELLKRTQEKGD